jgi:hypothetical protein
MILNKKLIAAVALVCLSAAAIAAQSCSGCSCVKVKGTQLCACTVCR